MSEQGPSLWQKITDASAELRKKDREGSWTTSLERQQFVARLNGLEVQNVPPTIGIGGNPGDSAGSTA